MHIGITEQKLHETSKQMAFVLPKRMIRTRIADMVGRGGCLLLDSKNLFRTYGTLYCSVLLTFVSLRLVMFRTYGATHCCSLLFPASLKLAIWNRAGAMHFGIHEFVVKEITVYNIPPEFSNSLSNKLFTGANSSFEIPFSAVLR